MQPLARPPNQLLEAVQAPSVRVAAAEDVRTGQEERIHAFSLGKTNTAG